MDTHMANQYANARTDISHQLAFESIEFRRRVCALASVWRKTDDHWCYFGAVSHLHFLYFADVENKVFFLKVR